MIVVFVVLAVVAILILIVAAVADHADPVEKAASRAMAQIDLRQAENRWRLASARAEMERSGQLVEREFKED